MSRNRSRILTLTLVAVAALARAEDPGEGEGQLAPATEVAPHRETVPAGRPAARVFTNEDLAGYGTAGDPGAAPEAGKRPVAEKLDEVRDAVRHGLEKVGSSIAEQRRARARARVDAAQDRIDALEADADRHNGDIDRTADGVLITGSLAVGWRLEAARAELARAEAALEAVEREQAE